MIWFSARSVIYYWCLKGGHFFGTGRLFLFSETTKCLKKKKNSLKTNSNRNCNSNKYCTDGECLVNVLVVLGSFSRQNDQPSNRRKIWRRDYSFEKFNALIWTWDHCFCNVALPLVCEQLKEDEPRLIRTPGAPNENIVQNRLNIALMNVFYYLNGR